MLGTSMLLVGNADLAYLNKNATSPENIGLWAWRLVLGAGIVVIIMGVVNIFTVSCFQQPPLLTTFLTPLTELHIPRHDDRSHCSPSPFPRRGCLP